MTPLFRAILASATSLFISAYPTLAQTKYTVTQTPIPVPEVTLGADAGGGVNYLDQVAGSILTASGQRHAFYYDAAHGLLDLGSLGGGLSRANAINDSGIVVGRSTIASGAQHAFQYTTASLEFCTF